MVTKRLLAGTLVAILFLAGTVLAAGPASVDWWTISSGGGSAMAGGTSLDGTIGQWAVGMGGNGPYQLCSGFWGCGASYEVFLPIIWRE